MRSNGEDGDVLDIETVRPALVTLTRDVRDMQNELLEGLASRRALLEWLQRATVRTLGTLDDDFYRKFGVALRSERSVLLGAVLAEKERRIDLDEDVARELRERLLARRLDPAFRNAFRHLRKDAGEYIDEAGPGDAHDPQTQVHIAMRPSLTEIDEYQGEALDRLLDGLTDGSDVLDWGKVLTLATHGEVEGDLVERCYLESSTRRVLTSPEPVDRKARELLAATHILPAFNAGVRDLCGKSGETAEAETTAPEAEFA